MHPVFFCKFELIYKDTYSIVHLWCVLVHKEEEIWET